MQVDVDGTACFAYTGTRLRNPALPTIAFVHGAANDHSVWALQSRYFAHHGFNVLAVDLPGHGRSGGTPLTTVAANADWIVRMLDATGTATTALVGHSMGSLVALSCAARYPDRVSKVALLGPAAPMQVSDDLMERARADDPVALELITGWSISARRQWEGNPVPGMWMTSTALRLLERSRPGVLATDLLACQSYADGLVDGAAIRCPVLAIIGGRDLMTPGRSAQDLLAALRDKRTLTLPRAGHSLMAEEPGAVLDALRAFL